MSLWGKVDQQVGIPKYLDRGQIVAVNVTSGGSGYRVIPSVTIAAPATLGAQATASAIMAANAVASVVSGGSDYVVGDILTLVGGTGRKAQLQVTEVNSGAITAASVVLVENGTYSALPVDPTNVAVTGGSGSDAVFSVTFKVRSITITNPGWNYVAGDEAGVTFDSGNATATAIKHGSAYDGSLIVFVDFEESQHADNIARGLNSPGWWLYKETTDSAGNTRYRNELLIALTEAVADAGDQSDDQIVPDGTIAITALRATTTIVDGATGTIAATATSSPSASLSYQWQKYNTSTGAWNNLTNAGVYTGVTTATLTLTAPAYDLNGAKYRVRVSASGFRNTFSTVSTLAITPVVISISVAPVATSVVAPNTASFSVTAATDPVGRTLSYQWQVQQAGVGDWANVTTGTGGTTASYTTAATTVVDDNTDKYRVIVSRSGATSVTSTGVVLTVTAA